MIKAIFKLDKIGIMDVCTVRCPRAVWVIVLVLGARNGLEFFLKDMLWLLTWIQS